MAGVREGYLLKKKKQAGSDDWNTRYFVLSDDYLTYFKRAQVLHSATMS